MRLVQLHALLNIEGIGNCVLILKVELELSKVWNWTNTGLRIPWWHTVVISYHTKTSQT